MTKTCKSCGKPLVEGVLKCGWCDCPIEQIKTISRENLPDTKENRELMAKIATKEDEITQISQTGPILLGVVALLIFLMNIVFLWFVVLVAALWWNHNINKQKKRLNDDIQEIEAKMNLTTPSDISPIVPQ